MPIAALALFVAACVTFGAEPPCCFSANFVALDSAASTAALSPSGAVLGRDAGAVVAELIAEIAIVNPP